jgi:riboflavin synthase
MFTGLIEYIGTVKNINASEIIISTKLDDIALGASIAVNGVCLTVTKIAGENLSFDYSPITDKITNLSKLKAGNTVNIERALKMSGRLGGHILTGHVDGTVTVKSVQKLDRFYKLVFSVPREFEKYIVAKGSAAFDGVSLTVAELSPDGVVVYIIPETYNNTTLSQLRAGSTINIETDILAKYTEKLLTKNTSGITEQFLKDNGF